MVLSVIDAVETKWIASIIWGLIMKKMIINRKQFDKLVRKTSKQIKAAFSANTQCDPKEVAYYTELVNQWFENRNKETQTIITLSAGGIGLLVALASSESFLTELTWFFVFYPLSILFFLFAMIIGTFTYRVNSNYLLELKQNIENPEKYPEPKSIAIYDYLLITLFITAVISAVFFFITHIIVNVI